MLHTDHGEVIRLLDQRGAESWKALRDSAFHRAAVESGRLISSTELSETPEGSALALSHPRVAMITYPYEWTFSMLRDAALLQLDLVSEALADGLISKDGTPYNIQFEDGRPVFIDIGSFEPYRRGEPWIGYGQFTRQFLFPLMLRAWVGIPFQPWLRGDMAGPSPEDMRRLLPASKRLRPGALAHVVLQARMEKRMEGTSVRRDMAEAGFSADMIEANLRRLRKLVESIDWEPDARGWSRYGECAHVGRDREAKGRFLSRVLGERRPQRVLDLGANDGHFSRLAAESGAVAIAVDGDEAVLDRLYSEIEGASISIALSDLADPSPSQGWAGAERPGLFQRARPDLVLAYGLVHHLIYTSSVPTAEVVRWLHGFGAPVVAEFVAPQDEMVVSLTANKRPEEVHPGADEAGFRKLVSARFEVVAEQSLGGGSRVLFELEPLKNAS